MLNIKSKSIFHFYVICFLVFILSWFFLFSNSCSASNKRELTEQELNMFSQNDIMFYDPSECIRRGGAIGGYCFKIDSNTIPKTAWYGEGCLNTGDCTDGKYFAAGRSPKTDNGLVATENNPWIYNDTKVDEDFAGMQYIYAENYDYEYNGSDTKMTPNGGNSTQKYYWIVLPQEAYTGGFGDTYVATFEKISEPVYFIVFDVHACGDQYQSKKEYCFDARKDPDQAIGVGFFGSFTKDGGSPDKIANMVGKLTSFCRINGTGEVTVNGSEGSVSTSTAGGGDSNSEPPSGKDITWIGDSYSCGALSIIKEKFSGISFGGSECNSKSYIMSNKGVSDRYGGGTENPPALTILKQVAEAGKLKSYLVMAIGTNAGWTDKEVNQFEDIMSSHQNTKVIFVNVKAKAHLAADDNGTNERLKALVNSNKNYYLADWAAAYDDKYFANDNTHPTANGGYEKWVEVISEALANTNGCHTYEGDYPQYYQSDYEKSDHENSDENWTERPYAGTDVPHAGCGPTSMAMLTTVATGQDVYPQDIIDITEPTGSYTDYSPTVLDPLVGEKYGFEVVAESYSSKTDAYNKIKEYLNNGYMIHLSGSGVHDGFSTSGGDHYVGIFKIDSDDNIWVANSNSVGNSQVELQDIIDAIHNGVFTAIKGSGGNGSCGGFCEDDDNTVIDDNGLTFEQAKRFMMNYGANKNNSSRDAVGDAHWGYCGGGGSNCATFSHFFVNKFTNLTYGDGDGFEVVDNLARENSSITVERSPRVWSVFSTTPNHTGIILGYHDGEWIVGHASCNRGKAGLRGKGNGGDGTWSGAGTGSGFVVKNSDIGKAMVVSGNPKYAYLDVDPNAIKSYLENGE